MDEKSVPGIFFLRIRANQECPVTEGTLVSAGLETKVPQKLRKCSLGA